MTKKIALLVDAWFPLYGGGQVHVAELARVLCEEHDYEVTVLTRDIKGRGSAFEKQLVDVDGLEVKKFGYKSPFGDPLMRIWYMVATFVYLIWRRKDFELIHAHAASAALVMKAASWFTKVPSVVTVHGSQIFRKRWTLRKILERVLYLETKYTQEITVSENFLKATNVNEQVMVIENGIDLQRFDRVKAEKRSSAFDVLFVGRLDPVKGLDVLLNAVKRVVESNDMIQSKKDFLLHIVGAGGEEAALKRQVEELDLKAHVRFHGKVTGDDLVGMYKAADLFVLPSRSEGFPLSLLEACAAKLPVLATDVGDNKKLVVEKANGHLVAPEDVEELAYYLEHFALNPGLAQMGEAGYELVKEEFTWAHVAEKTLLAYERALKQERLEAAHQWDRLKSLLRDRRMPWHVPALLLKRKGFSSDYGGRLPLRFSMTVDVEHSYGSAELPHEDEHVPNFFERFTDMCSQLDMPATFFVQGDLIPQFSEEVLALKEAGHEIGVHGLHHELWGDRQWFLKDAWQAPLKRQKALHELTEILGEHGLKDVHTFRAPNMVADETTFNLLKDAGYQLDSSGATMLGAAPLPSIEGGLCRMPVSRDPQPQIQKRFGLPFGRFVVFNLANFLEASDGELLDMVNRLREYHRQHDVAPHLVFLCHSWEFQSRDEMAYASGENYTKLAKRLALLKDNMDVEFMTLSDLCAELYAD